MSTRKKAAKCPVCGRRGTTAKDSYDPDIPWNLHVCGDLPCLEAASRIYQERMRPHAFGAETIVLTWQALENRGTASTRLAWAIVEETGLLFDEIANIRRDDIDVMDKELFVREQRTITKRWVPFGKKTDQCLTQWLRERDEAVSHDRLLHQPDRRGYTGDSLRREIESILRSPRIC